MLIRLLSPKPTVMVTAMVKRQRPNCGAEWYSAAAESTWTCEQCGAEIPVPGETGVE